MKDMTYVFKNFFTHKDFLVPAGQIPGTMFTPLHFLFTAVLLTLIVSSALFVARRKKLLKPVLAFFWVLMIFWEAAIIYWDSTAGKTVGWDLKTNLSLYPCSLYLYTMPFILWGKGRVKQACCGYLCTVGLLGALINLMVPTTRLWDYSCISFAGMHTLCFHGTMFFTYLSLVFSDYHRYDSITCWRDLLLPSLPCLLLSIPANLLNYTIGSDYMFFTGQFPVVARIFGNTRPILITLTLYVFYILVPALFYVRGLLRHRRVEQEDMLLLTAELL